MSENENAESFSLSPFLDPAWDTLESKLARFAPFARSVLEAGMVMREVAGPAGRQVPVRHPQSGQVSDVLMFGSNNYLGLANEPFVVEKTIEALRTYGVGCGGPPLLNGMTSLHRELERRLADLKGCEDAMIFSSGYGANLGWVTGLLGAGDVLVYDVQNHASLYDGIKMGRTRSVAFAHNDVADLRKKLMQTRWQRAHANIVVCVEGVYSMDGDIAPLPAIRKLCTKYGALLAVDEAHATGTIGPTGGGTAEHYGMEKGAIDLVMGTFSKTFAVTGAFIAGKRDLVDYLRFFARSYMFSAALPPPVVASVLAGIEFLKAHPERVTQLHDNVTYLCSGLRASGFAIEQTTAIVPIFVPSHLRMPQVVTRLHEEGLFVNGIEYPAVPKDRQRLRLSVMATMTRADLDFAVEKLTKVGREMGFLDMTDFSPEERLLVLASYAELSRAESDEARALAGRVDWPTFAELAEGNATVPLVRATLAKLRIATPADVGARFAAIADQVTAANTARLAVGRTLLARLGELNVPVVILKGVLFAETLYRNPSYKKMNDIDILIRREDLDTIYAVYAELGFFSAAELFSDGKRKQEKFSHHSPPFFSRDLTCMIGTHWGLITPLAPYKLDYEAIWSRVVDITLGGVPAKAMAPEDNLHHLCVHLPYYKTGVRELADVYNLLRAHRIDWKLFLGEVRKAKTENLVFHALTLVQRLSPRPDVADVLSELRPAVSWLYARDAARKTRRAGLVLRSRSVHMSRIEKAYADFTATKHAGEKRKAYARVIGNILFPPPTDVVKMSSLDTPSRAELLVGRLVAPWRISRVFVRDLGAGIYAAMLAKATIDTAVDSVKQAINGSPANDGYQAYAAKLGLSVADLERLKDALE